MILNDDILSSHLILEGAEIGPSTILLELSTAALHTTTIVLGSFNSATSIWSTSKDDCST